MAIVDAFSKSKIKLKPYATEVTNVIEADFTEGRNPIVILLESTLKPRFLAK